MSGAFTSSRYLRSYPGREHDGGKRGNFDPVSEKKIRNHYFNQSMSQES